MANTILPLYVLKGGMCLFKHKYEVRALMKSLALVQSPSKISGKAPAIQVVFPPPTRNPPGSGAPGPPPPRLPPPGPPGFPPGFPPNGFGPPDPELARGLGWKENALVIAVAIWVDIMVGCAEVTGEVFSCEGMSIALKV